MKRDSSKASEAHLEYEVAARRPLEEFSLSGQPRSDSVRANVHSKDIAQKLDEALRALGFKVKMIRRAETSLVNEPWPNEDDHV